jgi:hypothetical protein
MLTSINFFGVVIVALLCATSCQKKGLYESVSPKVRSVEQISQAKAKINLFMADVNGVPWIVASVQNESSKDVTINTHFSKQFGYTVIDKITKEELPYIANYMGMPPLEGQDELTISGSSSVTIMTPLPPCNFKVEVRSSETILNKYKIRHDTYGEVELFL